jgi:hypothetical protein
MYRLLFPSPAPQKKKDEEEEREGGRIIRKKLVYSFYTFDHRI